MQISDLFGQLKKAPGMAVSGETGVKSTEQTASSIRELVAGAVFEGTVNELENGQVALGLPNGSKLLARIAGAVTLQEGQSMFFQVKSNNGTTIEIKPFLVDGKAANPILSDALQAANLPADEKNLNLVKSMMEEQLPIDKGHLSAMARVLLNNPGLDPDTVVALVKYNIPVTAENAAQYENYKADRQSVTKQMDAFLNELPEALSDGALSKEELFSQGGRLLSILSGDAWMEAETASASQDVLKAGGLPEGAEQQGIMSDDAKMLADSDMQQTKSQLAAETSDAGSIQNQTATVQEEAIQTQNDTNIQIRQLFLTETAKESREALLKELTSGKSDAGDVMKELAAALSDKNNWQHFDTHEVRNLFRSEAFKKVLSDAVRQQWSIKPEELTEEGSVRKLYEKLDGQLKQLEAVVKQSGQSHPGIEQAAADIRSNIQFMDQISQVYHYVQLPLKMSGQNANGELYVYTNKKASGGAERELSAFLHLDMENLGETDVSVKLFQNNVSAKFYMDSDEAYALVKEHMPALQKRLSDKGYHCTIEAINEEKKMNFVDDFLNRDKPQTGQVRRYSFDMRA